MSLRRRRIAQAGVVFQLELARLLRPPGVLGLALVAALPALPLLGMWAAIAYRGEAPPISSATESYATIFQTFLLRVVLFFGCVVIFTSLVRRELRERTLHHWFLAPVAREVVLAGKYLAGLTATFLVFGGSAVVTFGLAYIPYWGVDRPALERFFLDGPGFGHLAVYLAALWLACLGFGAVFLAAGVYLKNPILPALAVFGWELANPFLPAGLKQVSILYWVDALYPVPLAARMFALLAERPPVAVSVLGLLALAAVLLVLAARRFRTMEVSYAEE